MYVSYTYLLRLELGEMSISVCVCVCVDARFYKGSFLKMRKMTKKKHLYDDVCKCNTSCKVQGKNSNVTRCIFHQRRGQ